MVQGTSSIKVSGKGGDGAPVLSGLSTRGAQTCMKQKVTYIFQLILANVSSEHFLALFLINFLFISSDSFVLSHT